MMRSLSKISLAFSLLLPFFIGFAQPPVVWQFRNSSCTGNETRLLIRADVAPGWHLYSQSLSKDGPIPTRFTFDRAQGYTLVGTTLETGNSARFYDNLYNMEITWYSGRVLFTQDVILNQPDVAITGKVVYMTCSDQICVPGEQRFSVKTSQ